MKLKVVDENKIILPCKPGDKYFKIERKKEISSEIRYDAWSGEPHVMERSKTVGKEIVEHKWRSYAEIVQALEVGRVDENIFLKREIAERKFEEYWEGWW